MNFVEAIARKRDGLNLDKEQIETFVDGASTGDLPPEQFQDAPSDVLSPDCS